MKPEAYITLGNEPFMKRFYSYLLGFYEHHGLVRPPTFFYDKTHINLTHSYVEFLDHMFYTTPKKAVNWESFEFPSTCVGHEGVGRAYQFLY